MATVGGFNGAVFGSGYLSSDLVLEGIIEFITSLGK
jgi:hypothetical protein